jgi:nucleotide-binding universal stress UspA family protein
MEPQRATPRVTSMFERIVVGYARDEAGRDGVLLASQLAALTGASLTVAIPYHPLLAQVPGDVAEQRARTELGTMLGDEPAIERARLHWSNASWPIHALHGLAEFEHTDLIVFGAAPERIGRRRVELMERMVHGSPCAVAVAPKGYAQLQMRPAIRRVGAGFDDTSQGRAAALAAVQIAQLCGGSLEIVSASGFSGALAGYAAMAVLVPDVERELLEQARSAAQRLACELSVDCPVEVEARQGDPAQVLLDAARKLDLLVLGSRAYGPVRHALLGSVSADVMRRASCPVLVLTRVLARANADLPRSGARLGGVLKA